MDSEAVQKSLEAATKSLAEGKQQQEASKENTQSSSSSSEDKPEAASEASSETAASSAETVDFKVIYNKKKYDVSFPLDSEVGALKVHLQSVIGLTPAMMKVLVKGVSRDEMTLRRLGVTKGSKVMVVGSTLQDVLALSSKASASDGGKKGSDGASDGASGSTGSTTKEAKQHSKVLEKGKPDDAMPGVKGSKSPLPPAPLSGMLNKHGGKLGPTEASRYWVYWVPAQYVDAIKDSILGKWQFY